MPQQLLSFILEWRSELESLISTCHLNFFPIATLFLLVVFRFCFFSVSSRFTLWFSSGFSLVLFWFTLETRLFHYFSQLFSFLSICLLLVFISFFQHIYHSKYVLFSFLPLWFFDNRIELLRPIVGLNMYIKNVSFDFKPNLNRLLGKSKSLIWKIMPNRIRRQ